MHRAFSGGRGRSGWRILESDGQCANLDGQSSNNAVLSVLCYWGSILSHVSEDNNGEPILPGRREA